MKIADIMTRCPQCIGVDDSIENAFTKMQLYKIRHLPVVDRGELIGVVTEQQVRLTQLLCNHSTQCPSILDITCKDPIVVQEDGDLGEIAREMAEKKSDVALVADGDGNFVGIFTTTDACRFIHIMIEETKLNEREDILSIMRTRLVN